MRRANHHTCYRKHREATRQVTRNNAGLMGRVPRNNRCGGFTLIELITVIVLLAVIASISTSFIVSSIQSYNQTQGRAVLINKRPSGDGTNYPPVARGRAQQRATEW